MAYQKMYMVPAEDPALVNLFKGRLTSDPTLDTAAKLLTRKMEILNNPNTSAAFKKQTIKQLDPEIELYVKKMRQFPAAFSAGADPAKLADALKDEEEDLVTPVQQKLLKRILSEVTPKREPVITPRLKKTRIPIKKPSKSVTTPRLKKTRIPIKKSSDSVPWDELPYAKREPELDVEDTLRKSLRKVRQISAKYTQKTPQEVKRLKPAEGWTSWDPSGKKKKKRKRELGSAAKQLSFDDS